MDLGGFLEKKEKKQTGGPRIGKRAVGIYYITCLDLAELALVARTFRNCAGGLLSGLGADGTGHR